MPIFKNWLMRSSRILIVLNYEKIKANSKYGAYILWKCFTIKFLKIEKYNCLDVINGTVDTIVIIKSMEFIIMVFYHKRKNVRHKSHNLFRGSFKKIEMIEIEILSNDNFPLWPEKPAFVGTTHLEIINNLYIECFSRKNEKKPCYFLH